MMTIADTDEAAMARRANRVGRIRCMADHATVNRIAQSRGLTAEPCGQRGEYFLVDSGRNLASEVEPDLLQATLAAMRDAARGGVIPPCSVLFPKSMDKLLQ